MRFNRAILLGVVLACDACTNPAPWTEAPEDAGASPLRVAAEQCAEALVEEEPSAAPGLAGCRGAGLSPDASCESQLSGWYALAYDLDVTYQDDAAQDEPAFEPGRGRLQLLFKAAVQDACPDADGGAQSWLQLCEAQLPALGARYTLALSDAQPHVPARFRASIVDARPQLQQAAVRVLSGITPPLDDSWPAYTDTPFFECGSPRRGSACFTDDDADGMPGISLQLTASTSSCERGLPSEPGPALPGRRVKALQLGLRTQLQGSVTFDPGCQTGVGEADATDLELRVLDCQLQNGAACSPLQAEHVDRHVPTYRVLRGGEGRGSTLTARRIAGLTADPSCQDVKSALGMSPH